MTRVELIQEKCVACRADSPHITDHEIAQLRSQVAEWTVIQALAFTNRVSALAEAVGHHPRLVTEWGKVTITWWTHAIRDLHRNDFIMAAKTDQSHKEAMEAQAE